MSAVPGTDTTPPAPMAGATVLPTNTVGDQEGVHQPQSHHRGLGTHAGQDCHDDCSRRPGLSTPIMTSRLLLDVSFGFPWVYADSIAPIIGERSLTAEFHDSLEGARAALTTPWMWRPRRGDRDSNERSESANERGGERSKLGSR
jgi:hypothetical protein